MLPVVQAFQQEISLTTAKIDHIFHQGEALIERSEPLDAAVIEEELEELQRYCQEVFGRVERYYKKLIRLPVQKGLLRVIYPLSPPLLLLFNHKLTLLPWLLYW